MTVVVDLLQEILIDRKMQKKAKNLVSYLKYI
jgi:hypothetical protein